MVPASFCAMRYIDNLRYLADDEDSLQPRTLKPRKAIIESRAAAVRPRKDCRKQQALHVVTLKSIRVGEKVFV